jgi:hypothetical protein
MEKDTELTKPDQAASGHADNDNPIPNPQSETPQGETPQSETPQGENEDQAEALVETGGPKGLEPTRFGDWEKNGRCSDF